MAAPIRLMNNDSSYVNVDDSSISYLYSNTSDTRLEISPTNVRTSEDIRIIYWTETGSTSGDFSFEPNEPNQMRIYPSEQDYEGNQRITFVPFEEIKNILKVKPQKLLEKESKKKEEKMEEKKEERKKSRIDFLEL